jgi:hypothetical protein
MRKVQKLRALFTLAIGIAVLLLIVWLFSVLPFTVADPVTGWQKLVEFCQDVIAPINANITLFLALYIAIFGGGYLAIVKTSKK